MAVCPPELTLPYRVGAAWLEERTLAGEIVDPVRALTIHCDLLDEDARALAGSVAKRVDLQMHDAGQGPVIVVGSGLRARDLASDGRGGWWHSTDLVVARLGPCPELPEPTSDPVELLSAYTAWIERALDLSGVSLTEWVERRANAPASDEETESEHPWWRVSVPFAVGDLGHVLDVDAVANLPLFHKAAAIEQALLHAQTSVGQEDWDAACAIIRPEPFVRTPPEAQIVDAWARLARRRIDLAFARGWTRARLRGGFDTEMRRWASAYGSRRLQMGLSDGYRMVPVYLEERLAAEAPGFYAHLPRRDDPHTWQPRTGPSEEALVLRRSVQERLERHTPDAMQVPRAEIGWMKVPPLAMCDPDHCYERDPEWGHPTDELRDWPFEVVGVRGWLGRYTLIAGVYTTAGDRPPPFLLLGYMLRPEDYGVRGIAAPPYGTSLDGKHRFPAPDDDIPF